VTSTKEANEIIFGVEKTLNEGAAGKENPLREGSKLLHQHVKGKTQATAGDGKKKTKKGGSTFDERENIKSGKRGRGRGQGRSGRTDKHKKEKEEI